VGEADFDYETRGKQDRCGFICVLHGKLKEPRLRWKCRNVGQVTECVERRNSVREMEMEGGEGDDKTEEQEKKREQKTE